MVQDNLREATDQDRDIILAKNLADRYWCREDDPNYQKACKEWQDMVETRRENPALVSLFKFASRYNKNWTHSNDVKVPHITPNFNHIPNKKNRTERYGMFLRSLLLSHKPATTIDGVKAMDFDQLEEECASFCESLLCPKMTREEFEESQKNLEELEDMVEGDGNEVDNPATEEEELLVLPEEVHEPMEQEAWMEFLREVRPDEGGVLEQEQLIEGEGDYDDRDLAVAAQEKDDWDAAAISEGLTTDDKFLELGDWVKKQKQGERPLRNFDALAGEPKDLNDKQLAAFGIVSAWMLQAKEVGVEAMPQLLLNISGAAGTGKSFWLNTLRKYSKTIGFRDDFIKTAAPTGSAAFLIGGETLHGLLFLPVNENKKHQVPELELQLKFKHCGLLVIDEKSMIGQRTLMRIDKHLRAARPHKQDQIYGGLSIILLGDFKQLPPVCDTAIYKRSAVTTHGFNLYRAFKDVIFFDRIQRQEGDDQKEFREQLERLAKGKFTEEDWTKWKDRNLDLLPPAEREAFIKGGILACARKKHMASHNVDRVRALGKDIAPIVADSSPPVASGEQNDNDASLPHKIILCEGAKIRLTDNLWTEAGLTNGAAGHVYKIIYGPGEGPPKLPRAILATFEGYIGPTFPNKDNIQKLVPIVPVTHNWMKKGRRMQRTQLPMILGYALTIHKLQGATEERIILNAGDT